jgi:hypothetical protein
LGGVVGGSVEISTTQCARAKKGLERDEGGAFFFLWMESAKHTLSTAPAPHFHGGPARRGARCEASNPPSPPWRETSKRIKRVAVQRTAPVSKPRRPRQKVEAEPGSD